ncbi:MAG: type II toxin-antitoxin system RelE/ParE family toxin [Burkholderiaceae bacterium]
MRIHWLSKASSDLHRLHEFVTPINEDAAFKILDALVQAVSSLKETPRLGRRVSSQTHEEVRSLVVRTYEIRYAIREENIYILRIWHTRESRQ